MTRWDQLPDLPSRRPGVARWAPVVAPVVVAAVFLVLGHPFLAAGVALVAGSLLAATKLRPGLAEVVARGAATFGRVVAGALSWVLLGAVQVLVLAPASALLRLAQRDPLGSPRGSSRWSGHAPTVSARRTFGREQARPPSSGPVARTLRPVPRIVGGLLALVLLNYGAGWLWDELVGSHDDPVVVARPGSTQARADSDAFAEEDWALDYWTDFDRLPIDPVPFLLTRVGDVDGDLISSRDGVRPTPDPAGPADAEVWLLGGGGAWGEGQRDDHTLAAALVARAAEDGVALRLTNLAQPGYTSWQSALLLEQQLAVRPAPDLVLRYEGVDDTAAQVEAASAAPTHYNVEGLSGALTGRESAREQVDDLWQEYRDTSALTRLATGVGSVLGSAFGTRPASAADDELGDRVLDLRARATALVAGVAERSGVTTVDVWQAATGVPGDGGAYRSMAVPTDDIDLRAALDEIAGSSVVAGTVVDEEGAAVVADALWAALAPRLDAIG